MPLSIHLESIERQTGKVHELNVNPPEMPTQGALVWTYFLQLHNRRECGLNGATPLTYAAIQAWQSVRHLTLEAWELNTILKLDEAYLEISQEKPEETDG